MFEGNLAIIPLRFEPDDKSEIVSQVLFGEHFEILEQVQQWSRIKLQYDSMKVGLTKLSNTF
jgi:hypothetical protein